MATTAAEVRADFGSTYKAVSDAQFYVYLNRTDVLIIRHFGLRKKTIYVPVTAKESLIDLAAGAVWIETARWIDAPAPTPLEVGGYKLTETNIDEKDTSDEDWRANSPGSPSEFMQTHDLTIGQLQLDRPTTYGTLIATAATNATPIVVTSSAVHGLADGDRVDIRNGLVMTNINGDHYAKVTGYSTTTFALYSDEDLTTAIAGNGVYTASSALISCENSPYLQLFTRWHEVLTSSSDLPDTPLFPDLYTDGCKFLYAKQHKKEDIGLYKATFEDVVAEQAKLTMQRSGRKLARVRVVTEREGGSVASLWGGKGVGRRTGAWWRDR